MPIYHDVEANSEHWLRLRIGRVTASNFDCVLTPGGKPSDQADGLMFSILAEMMVGHPILGPETHWMRRGIELEDDAVESWEFKNGIETKRGGFVTNQEGAIGCSPDRLVGEDGLLQIKTPTAANHVKYLVTKTLEQKYKPQIQGELYVTGRNWIEIASYNPEMPLATFRIERDADFIIKLEAQLEIFVAKLAARRAELEEKFGEFPNPIPEPALNEHAADFLTEADAELILKGQRDKPDYQRAISAYCTKVGSVAFAGILLKHGVTEAGGINESNWRPIFEALETFYKEMKQNG